MEKELWKELPEKMMELERDREETMDLKKKIDKLKNDDENIGGPLITFLLLASIGALIGGFTVNGIWGVLTNVVGIGLPMFGIAGAYDEWKKKRTYIKEFPGLRDRLEEEEKRNQKKYKDNIFAEIDTLISKKIFSAEAVHFLADIISHQGEIDVESAIESYCNSEKYRPNLVAMNSEKNKNFLTMILEKGE